MATLLEALVGLSWLVNLVLDIGAASYCYRLTRITGGFRAWWLMIIFTIFFAIQSFSGVSYSVLSSSAFITGGSGPTQLVGSALFSVVLGLLMSAVLFVAMFEIFRTFRRIQKVDAKRSASE